MIQNLSKKMKQILSILFLFLFLSSFSQEEKRFLVLSKTDSLKIVNAHILINNQKVVISDYAGIFKLNDLDSVIQLKISCIGFKDSILDKKDLVKHSTIYLEEAVFELAEVALIHKKKEKSQKTFKKILPKETLLSKFGYFKGHRTMFDSEYVTFLPNKLKQEYRISSILINVSDGYWSTNQLVPFKVNLYSVDTTSIYPDQKLLKENLWVKNYTINDSYIEIDIYHENIVFPLEGIFVCVEILGRYDYQKINPLIHTPPIFKIKNKKNSNSVTLRKTFGNIKLKNWEDDKFYPTDFIYDFGIIIEK